MYYGNGILRNTLKTIIIKNGKTIVIIAKGTIFLKPNIHNDKAVNPIVAAKKPTTGRISIYTTVLIIIDKTLITSRLLIFKVSAVPFESFIISVTNKIQEITTIITVRITGKVPGPAKFVTLVLNGNFKDTTSIPNPNRKNIDVTIKFIDIFFIT